MKLLVAALESELVAFPESIPGFERLVTGAGKLQAAVHLTQVLERASYDEIVVVGTAGGIDQEIGSGIYEIAAAIQHDVKDEEGVVGNHMFLPPRLETGRAGVVIATGDYFVDDAATVAVLRELGASLVDMETFVFLWVAQQYDTPIRVLRAISDTAQDGATQTWDETVAACSAQLWDYLSESLDD